MLSITSFQYTNVNNHLPSVVTPKHRQVKSGTEVTLSCEISDLDSAVKVEWVKDQTVITTDEQYTVSAGSPVSGKQTATLVISGIYVEEDARYTCRVQSIQYDKSPNSNAEVKLDVYGEFCIRINIIL